MNFEPTRKRREVAPFTVTVLRLVGWRFSYTRAAWVFRIRKGRYGPVFVVRDDVTRPADPADQTGFAVVSVAESAVAAAEAAVAAAASASQRSEPAVPLPRRAPRTPATAPTAPEPSDADGYNAPAIPTDGDSIPPEGAWKVDGRPTFPHPQVNPSRLRSVSGTAKSATA